jgi:hypothetical protein
MVLFLGPHLPGEGIVFSGTCSSWTRFPNAFADDSFLRTVALRKKSPLWSPQHGRREVIIFVIFHAENFRKVDAGAEIKVGVPPFFPTNNQSRVVLVHTL